MTAQGNSQLELPYTIENKECYAILGSGAAYFFVLCKFTSNICCTMNLAQLICVTLATNAAISLLKVAKVCLKFRNNVVHCIDPYMVLDLAAPIVLGMD